MASTVADLPERFRALAQQCRELAGADQAAKVWEKAADEVETTIRKEATDVLTLRQASEYGGYSESSLSRMIREKRVRNAGSKHSPRIRRVDVPKKPGHETPDLAPRRPRAHGSIEEITRDAVGER